MFAYPQHPISYRQEIAAPLFKYIQSGESCVVVGAASMAKSNLVNFLLRSDVQAHYLQEQTAQTLLAVVDTNRIGENTYSDWAVYELLLNSLVDASLANPESTCLTQPLSDIHRELVLHRDRLLAQRYVERSIRLICTEHSLRLALLIDDADSLYREASTSFLNNLRALRDMNKYQVCYILFTRQLLKYIRNVQESESFYELLNRNILGLTPYRPQDARRIIEQQENRKKNPLSENQREWLFSLSGGHPGILIAAFDVLKQGYCLSKEERIENWLKMPMLYEECQKLWNSLSPDERWMLIRVQAKLQSEDPEDILILQELALKGLILPDKSDGWSIFSSLFGQYVVLSSQEDTYDFCLDEDTASVCVAGRQITNLTHLEYQLIKILFDKRGQVLGRDFLLEALYPDEFNYRKPSTGLQDNRIDNMIRRLRNKIEVNPAIPRYILTKRGHGYTLKANSIPDNG